MDVKQLLSHIRALRKDWQANDAQWKEFVNYSAKLCLAESAQVFEKDSDAELWMPKVTEPDEGVLDVHAEGVSSNLLNGLFSRTLANQFAVQLPEPNYSQILVAIKLVAEIPTILLLKLPADLKPRLSEMVLRAQLLADICADNATLPAELQPAQQMKGERLVEVLDLLVEVFEAKRFTSAVYALVNGLVAREESIEQIAFGWREDAYVKLKALSHADRVERKTETMKLMEAALEESADQHQSVWCSEFANPNPQDLLLIDKAHQQLRTHLGAKTIFSFCLEDSKGESVAALSLYSYSGSFDEDTLHILHFVSGLLLPRLQELYLKEANLWVRSKAVVYQAASQFFGKDYVWIKLIAFLVTVFVLWAIFGKLSHRIEGVAQLTTDSTQVISAPFDGYLRDVDVTSGDLVDKGARLAQLDINEIMLQSSEVEADIQRFQAEADKARAAFSLIDAEIAMARKAQMEAKLQRISFYLEQASLKAPFGGIIVEGQRKDLLGAPKRKGELIFKIARIEGMYLSIEVPEEDAHFIQVGDRGEFSFISQPDLEIGFEITNMLPIAQVKGQAGAKFSLKAKFDQAPEDWWRPGMTGVAKVDKGDKNALWVLGHKAYNKLELMFWW